MKFKRIHLIALCAFGLPGLALSLPAAAGCYAGGTEAPRPQSQRTAPAAPQWVRTAFRPVADDDDDRASIVGLWKFEMISQNTATYTNPMPDGSLIDFGTAAWHSDGTELMNSGIRNPADGDFCQGVWDRAGRSTYVLNHYALAYSNGTYTGPVNIRERVTVDASGRHFSGWFTLVAYLASVTAGHEFDQNAPLVTITGTITATRVTTN